MGLTFNQVQLVHLEISVSLTFRTMYDCLKQIVLFPQASAQVCRESDLDLLIVLDGSSSIGNENFEFIRKFLVRLIDNLTKHTRVALVQFSGFPREEFRFDSPN